MENDWFLGENWIEKMEKEAEKIRIGKEVDKRLLENVEYQRKLKDIDIKLGLLREKIKELLNSKTDLTIEYTNKELENMGSKYRYPKRGESNPLGLV